jgi:hypothetical protein
MANYRVSVIGAYMGQLIVNTMAFRDRAGGAGSASDLAISVDAWLTASFRTIHSQYRTFTLIDVRTLGVAVPEVAQQVPTSVNGSVNTLGGNPAEAIVLSLKSALASRRTNGRMYLSGFGQDYVQQGSVVPAVATGPLATMVGTTLSLWGPAGTEPYSLGIWSDPGPDKLGQPRAPIFTDVRTIRINLITGSMRSRRIGVGA